MKLDQETNEELLVLLFEAFLELKMLTRLRLKVIERSGMRHFNRSITGGSCKSVYLPRCTHGSPMTSLVAQSCAENEWDDLPSSFYVLNGHFDQAVDLVKRIMVIYERGVFDKYSAQEIESYVKPLLRRRGKYIV